MKTVFIMLALTAVFLSGLIVYGNKNIPESDQNSEMQNVTPAYWFILHRASNREYLYYGPPGNIESSRLIRDFIVKTGVPGKKPTPLPQLAGRDYWIIVDKMEAHDNPETGPYFLTFDTESGPDYPYGPSPYLECGGQCNWEVAGYFGLHGVAGNPDRLADADPGSSGCVRHSDNDITYLYNLLDPVKSEIRYYIKDI